MLSHTNRARTWCRQLSVPGTRNCLSVLGHPRSGDQDRHGARAAGKYAHHRRPVPPRCLRFATQPMNTHEGETPMPIPTSHLEDAEGFASDAAKCLGYSTDTPTELALTSIAFALADIATSLRNLSAVKR